MAEMLPLQISIEITGPRAVGKTHLAKRLSDFLDQQLMPSQKAEVTIITGPKWGKRTVERKGVVNG